MCNYFHSQLNSCVLKLIRIEIHGIKFKYHNDSTIECTQKGLYKKQTKRLEGSTLLGTQGEQVSPFLAPSGTNSGRNVATSSELLRCTG